MASLFRGRRDEPTPNPSDTNSTNSSPNKWLVGLVSGAGKLISSVFRSSEGSSSEDEFDEDDDMDILVIDEKDDVDESQRRLQASNQDKIEETKVISPISPSRAAIEQLLTKETFSREESVKLIKLIQSRVVEPSSLRQKEEYNYNNCEAVLEAKKWLMKKKQTSKSHDLGPCTLNTDMTQFGMESDIGSPVDVAKSYMQSKPPWKSPFLTNNNDNNSSSTVFKTPSLPPSGPREFNDDIKLASSSFNYSFPSSKGLKRDYFSTGLWDPLEDSSRRIRSKLIQTGSSSKLFESEFISTSRKESADAMGGKENEGNPVPESGAQGPTCENNGLMQDSTNQKPIEENAEIVILDATAPVKPGERNNEKIASHQGLKEPNVISEPRPSEGGLNITNSLHESTNKISTNGMVEKSNMESGFESSTNGGPTSSTGTGTKSHTFTDTATGTVTGTGTKALESDVVPVRRGRKRVVSGRGRGKVAK